VIPNSSDGPRERTGAEPDRIFSLPRLAQVFVGDGA